MDPPPARPETQRPWRRVVSWELGIRILNLVLEPEVAGALCAVNQEFLHVVYDCNAWAGLVVHVEHLEVPTAVLSRMLPAWRLINRLYMTSFQARRLGGTCPCPVAWIWCFGERPVRIVRQSHDARYVLRSTHAFPPGPRLEFYAFCHGAPLVFDVGWATDASWTRIINHYDDEPPQRSGAFYLAAFRVAIGATIAPPGADRATWINSEATTEFPAVRLSTLHRRRFYETRTLLIGLEWNPNVMHLYVNEQHYGSGPSGVADLHYPLLRYPVLILAPGISYDDIELEPIPLRQ